MKFFSLGTKAVITGFTLTGFSTLVVMLRLYCRKFLVGSIKLHDYMMLLALLATWGNTVINYYQFRFGESIRPSKFPHVDAKTAANISGTLFTWFLYRFTYIINLFIVKLSILLFYRSIASHVWFRRSIYATIAFLTVYTAGMVIANIFQCQNPPDAWSVKVFLGQFSGHFSKCYNPTLIWFVQAGMNLFTDVIILILPIPSLLGLRIALNKRLVLVGIFSIGIIAIAASCVRLGMLAPWAQSTNSQARYGATILLWGQVEVNSGIISASIPFLRPLFKRSFGLSSKSEDRTPQRNWVGSSKPAVDHPSVNMSTFSTTTLAGRVPDEKTATGMPTWSPFITVPDSLSSQVSSNRSTIR